MKSHSDVMRALAEARPARLDPPGTPPCPVPPGVATAPAHRVRRFRAAALVPAGALAAVAVAAVVSITAAGSEEPPPATGDSGSSEAARPLSAAQILLTAAERSTGDSLGSGRYLVFGAENGSVLTVGTGKTYQMTVKSAYEHWLSRSGKEPGRTVAQTLGMVPAGPSDAAAWRAAGSPTKVMVHKPLPNGDLGPGSPAKTSAGPRETSPLASTQVYGLGDSTVSVRDLEDLPADPTALRAALLERFDGVSSELPANREQWLLAVGSALIVDIPVSGPVRSAAFRMIAELPGVRSLGTVSDQRGRQGQGFAFTATSAVTGSIEHRFVIDPATGRALGQETRALRPAGTTAAFEPGNLLNYTVVLEQRTTDEAPPK